MGGAGKGAPQETPVVMFTGSQNARTTALSPHGNACNRSIDVR